MIIIHLTFYFKNILRQGFKPKNGLKNYMENYVLMQILKSQEWAEPINLCSIIWKYTSWKMIYSCNAQDFFV